MRNLRLYETDAAFKAYEQGAGGTGNDVETIVPGIVKTSDLKKMYFNPHDKNIQFHTLTIYYKNIGGEEISSPKTMLVKYIPGVTERFVVTPKNIDGYSPVHPSKTVTVPTNDSVTFKYYTSEQLNTPLTFNIISSGTIYWRAQNTAYMASIEYKKNDGEWVSITATTGGTPISVSAGDVVQFIGNNATYCSVSLYYNSFSGSTAKFEVEGNIMSLIYKTNFATATTLTSSYTFYSLFNYCTGLTSAENLVLPATKLASGCYGYMFNSCSSLATAPELPATTLADDCYNSMFFDCTSLTTAPELHATTLAERCYQSMFNSCSSLTSAPELPATALARSCYQSMFWGCTSLTTAPELPATTLTNNCYYNMFYYCISLTAAPELPATTLARSCYYSMFDGCTNLTSAPALPATTLADYCYSSMFNGCTGLTTTPELPATTLTNGCYNSMFGSCTSLTTAPELPAGTLAYSCYEGMFYNCASLTGTPALPATTLENSCYKDMFYGCRSLNYIKCLATNISAVFCVMNWVSNVSSSGTFVKNPNMSSWTSGKSGIPDGWTVEDAS